MAGFWRSGVLAGLVLVGVQAGLVAEESAVVPDSLAGRFGLSLGAGYSPGNRTTPSINSPTDNLVVDRGSGLAWDGQLLFGLTDDVEASLGVFSPIGYETSGSGTYSTGNVNSTYDFKYEAKASGMPIMLGLRYHMPTPYKFGFFGGVGLGWFTGGEETSSRSDNYAPASTSNDYTSKNSTTYGGGVAYRSELGAEYKLTRSFSLELCGAVLLVPMTPSLYTGTSVNTSQAGAPRGTSTYRTTYKDNPTKPRPSTSTSVDNRVSGTGTVVTTIDSGYRRTVYTDHYVSGSYQYADYDFSTESPITTAWLAQVSLKLAAVLRF